MSLLDRSDTYWNFIGQCTQCGHCTRSCESLIAAGMTLGDIAQGMLDAERGAQDSEELMMSLAANPELTQAVRGCFFCTSCQNTCFAHNDVEDLISRAREDYQRLGLVPRDTFSTVEVDREWDIFTAYRAIHGISLEDMKRHVEREGHQAEGDCEVAFFPGCSLAAYAPDLTREIFATIEKLGGKTTLIDHCCGSPLKSAGFFERADALCDLSSTEIAASGAKTLVCVCPGCGNAMKKALARNGVDVRVTSLSRFLLEHGFASEHAPLQGEFCISKACQDRDGSYLADTLELLGLDSETPKIFHGCCGAGGAVSSFQPERMDAQTATKLDFAPDGSTIVTMCPTCTYTYAFYLMQHPRDVRNKHYAELIFDAQIDWDLVFAQLQGMWSGEYGPWLAQVFA